MPGKPFYSLDEVCLKLGKKPDDVKALVRDGTLREFRDAGKVFFKAEDIDKLAAARAAASGSGSGEILLEPADGADKIPMDDGMTGVNVTDSSGGTSIIGLEPLPEEEEQESKKEDTAVITSGGVGVFDDDEMEIDADPMAKTQITTGTTDDQVSLEGAGSGSGLLDLAREADDTALGADLLDEIYPGEEDAAAPVERAPAQAAEAETAEAAEEAEEAEVPLEEPVAVEVLAPAAPGDASEGMFSGLLVGALLLMVVAVTVVAGAVQGYLPDYGKFLGDGSIFYFFLGGSVLLALIALLVGWFLSKALVPRRR